MMHYSKGENIEKEITKSDLPFDGCLSKEKDFLWMKVRGGTKLNNVITFAKNCLEKGEHRQVVWTGSGGGLVKAVSCAEIIKRSFPLYQLTRMCYTSVEEHWKAQLEGLEDIVANRQIPCLHILMSLDPIDVKGVQEATATTDFCVNDGPAASRSRRPNDNDEEKAAANSQKKRNRFRRPKQQQQQNSDQQNHHPLQNPQSEEPNDLQTKQQHKPQIFQNQQQQHFQKTQQQNEDEVHQNTSSQEQSKTRIHSQKRQRRKQHTKDPNVESMES